MPRRWLVTGGCGFIGRNLIAQLVREGGHDVRVIDSFLTASPDDLEGYCGSGVSVRKPGEPKPDNNHLVDIIEGDILDADAVTQAVSDRDVIVHLAANTGVAPSVENPMQDCTVNVIGTLNCLEAARHGGIERFVFASSGAPVGEVEHPLHENLAARPVSPYGASKLAGEGYCSAYARTFGLQTVALRFGNVYGPGSAHKSSVVAKFILQTLAEETLEIFGDGGQTRDFIFVGDLLNAIRQAASKDGVGGEIFQIATNAETTVLEMFRILKGAYADAGIQIPEVTFGEARQGDVLRNYSDTSKARKMLDWQAQTDLAAGLRETLEWFLDRSPKAIRQRTEGGCNRHAQVLS